MNDELERAIESDRKRLEAMTVDDLGWEYFKRFKIREMDRGQAYMVERLLAARWNDALAKETSEVSPPSGQHRSRQT